MLIFSLHHLITDNFPSEMRNPLSAIVQCADWIGTSLTEFEAILTILLSLEK